MAILGCRRVCKRLCCLCLGLTPQPTVTAEKGLGWHLQRGLGEWELAAAGGRCD